MQMALLNKWRTISGFICGRKLQIEKLLTMRMEFIRTSPNGAKEKRNTEICARIDFSKPKTAQKKCCVNKNWDVYLVVWQTFIGFLSIEWNGPLNTRVYRKIQRIFCDRPFIRINIYYTEMHARSFRLCLSMSRAYRRHTENERIKC